MTIEHLKKLEQNKKIGHDTIEGVSEAIIKQVESGLILSFRKFIKNFFIWQVNIQVDYSYFQVIVI